MRISDWSSDVFSSDLEEEKKDKMNEIISSLDVEELKSEILELIAGIEEGASRTTSIVKSLRIFSNVDGRDLKAKDVNEGISYRRSVVKGKSVKVSVDPGGSRNIKNKKRE